MTRILIVAMGRAFIIVACAFGVGLAFAAVVANLLR